MTVLFIMWVFILALAGVRNELVFRLRRKRIEEICEANLRRVLEDGNFKLLSYGENMGNYHGMMAKLHKWTYKQFYPEALK